MCGRFYIAEEDNIPSEELHAIIDEINRKQQGSAAPTVKTSGEVFPTNIVPVLTAAGAEAMYWGFTGFDGKTAIINSRSEGITTKPMFRAPVQTARCLIPASWYFEWQKTESKKIKQRIQPVGQRLMYMAGIYRTERDRPVPVFSIITRDASPCIEHIHNRMPVILDREARNAWLSPSAQIDSILLSRMNDMVYQADQPMQTTLF